MRHLFAITLVLGVFSPSLTLVSIEPSRASTDGGALAGVKEAVAAPRKDVLSLIESSRAFPDRSSGVVARATESDAARRKDVEVPRLMLARLHEPSTRAFDLEQTTTLPEKAPESSPDKEPQEESSQSEPTSEVELDRVCEAVAIAANRHDLPIGFLARLIWQESRFDQWARSPAGAQGVAQFMPRTARSFGLEDPFDPLESVATSALFLRQLRDQFGNLGLAAAAYNAGSGRISKWLNGQSALPKETQNYVQIITGQPASRWKIEKPVEISVALPRKAPCDGIRGLSRSTPLAQLPVALTRFASNLIAEAEAAQRAKVAALQAQRTKLAALQAQRKKRQQLVAAKRSGAEHRKKAVAVASAER